MPDPLGGVQASAVDMAASLQESRFSEEGSRDVHVWLIRPVRGEPSAAQSALLDESERERADRFVFARDRDQYVVAHAWLRTILADSTGLPNDRLRIGRTPLEKPYLIADDPVSVKTHFSLSHTEGLIAVAVSTHCEVGVDVERIRPWSEVESFAHSVLHPKEFKVLSRLGTADKGGYFFRTWTAKEAYTKATGLGLSHAFESIDTGFDDARSDWRHGRLPAVSGFPSACLQVSTVAPNHALAVAALAAELCVALHTV